MKPRHTIQSCLRTGTPHIWVPRYPRDNVAVWVNDELWETGHNMIVNTGLAEFALVQAGDAAADPPTYMAIGTGSTAIMAGDTTLESEVDRVAIASTSASSGIVTYKAFWGQNDANGNTISNAGLFNDASAGDLFAAYVLSSTIAKTTSISLTITWTITLSDA